jgi:hypothetical protein
MTPAEAAALLTIAAAYDNRKPDADAAKAWAMALEDYPYDDCRTAVVEHYRESRDWLMPSDVIDGVKHIRKERLIMFGPLPPPPEELRDNFTAEQEWTLQVRRQIAEGHLTRADFPPAISAPVDQEAVDRAMALVRAAMPRKASDA